ncbi:MAG: type II toxin-antitoxin system Phd/YefM family antitoxin [Clostridia bacterium]|nr:type II toxin-antitoxin system Phd/YefM family antitoxin [Clostridia bacterium]
MINMNATSFRKQLFELIEQTIKYNEPVNINTKNGNAVLISEEEYNSLMETIYLTSIPGMKEKLESGAATPIEECDDFEW